MTPTSTSGTTPSESGAAPSAQGVHLRIELVGEPQLGNVPVVVYLLEDGSGVSGAQVQVTGDMTHAGMAPVIRDAVETEPGLYRADDFTFTMAGDWILTADIVLADGSKHQVETSVTVRGS